MLVLALDTSTRLGSCALARDGVVIRENASDPSREQAARLPHELMSILHDERYSLDDIDVFAVATGPGSFTGLRVGIATMQGLAFAGSRPLIGVSAMDALAHVASAERVGTKVATWVDAWRGEVYAALYEVGCEVEPPTVEHPKEVLERLHGPTLFIGDGVPASRDLISHRLGSDGRIASPTAPLLAGALAILATAAARAGHQPPPDAIRPLYVRRPDAELARDARRVR